MSVGMPQSILLRQFGQFIYEAFGHRAYHVGSSLTAKDGWRDVDVRVMIPDEEYESMGLGDPHNQQRNARWVAITLAWSAFGRAYTGLPIDFQIQQLTYAREHESGPSSALIALERIDWSKIEPFKCQACAEHWAQQDSAIDRGAHP